MALFSSRSESFLGIDFGTQSIKAVELKLVNGKPTLSNYAWVNVNDVDEVPKEYNSDYAKRLSGALHELLIHMKPKAKTTTVAIPSFNGLIMIVDFPRMSEKDVAHAIKFESRKYIPASLDEVNISWEILKEEDKKENESNKEKKKEEKNTKDTMKVLLVAAPKSEVQYYDSLFEGEDLQIKSLELEAFSLVRSLIGNKEGRFVSVDVGAKTTNILLVQDGVIHVSRSVDVGGSDVTNAIMQSMNITRKRAIKLKEGGDNFFTGPTNVEVPSLNFIANEIQRVLETQQNNKADKIILTGGGANLVGIEAQLEKMTNIKVEAGDPLQFIAYKEGHSGHIVQLAPTFAVAIGLALRSVEEK